ncbi:UNVERIFIED_CONTAM: hypothetical protein Sradi_6679500 [Sesamum radiatum]|uniref:Uncharacterized protein n=1 Tax=Sesamum radiatum TaxID=300843 RepID=A0AAW2JPY5_SESRA
MPGWMHFRSRPIKFLASVVSLLLGVEHLEGVALHGVEMGLVHGVAGLVLRVRLVHGVAGLVR